MTFLTGQHDDLVEAEQTSGRRLLKNWMKAMRRQFEEQFAQISEGV